MRGNIITKINLRYLQYQRTIFILHVRLPPLYLFQPYPVPPLISLHDYCMIFTVAKAARFLADITHTDNGNGVPYSGSFAK